MARALAIPAGQDEVTPSAAQLLPAADIAHRKSIMLIGIGFLDRTPSNPAFRRSGRRRPDSGSTSILETL
jgi:hypothetical protein